MATRAIQNKPSNDKPTADKQRSGQKPVDVSNVSRKDKSDVDDFDYDSIIQKAESTDNPDGYKYQVAVQMARNKAGSKIDDSDMRDLVDSEFAKLNPSATGAAMRGENNLVAQTMGGFSEARDNLSDMIGTGIDWFWDAVPGNIAGLAGNVVGTFTGDEDTGKDWNERVSGLVGDEDGAIFDTRTLGDIATGIGIAAIPGIGVPLSAGLALADNADNIREAIEGRDSITREKLDDDERWTKAGSAALDTVLSALPGIGKLRNTTALNSMDDILANSDDIAKGISEASTLGKSLNPSNMAKIAADAALDMPARIAGRAASTGSGIKKAVTDGGGVRKAIGNIWDAVRTPSNIAKSDNFNRQMVAAIRGGANPMGDLSGALGKTTGSKAGDMALNTLGSGVMGTAGGYGKGIIDYAAETNQNPLEAVDTYLDDLNANSGGDIWTDLRSIALPLGVNAVLGANRLAGPSGKYGLSRSPLRFAQLNAGGEVGERAGEASPVGTTDADTLADWIESFANQER